MDWWSRSGTVHRKYTGLPRRIDRNEYYFALLHIVRQVTIGTVNISIPRAALQRRRGKCGSLTGRVGYRFLCTTSATLWSLAKPLNSLRPSDAYIYIYICVGNLTIIDSDTGLSPGRRQAITWTNVGILLFGPLGTNFSGMLIEIHTF